MKAVSKRQLASAVIAKLRTQVRPSPEANFMLSVISQAITDLHNPQLYEDYSKGNREQKQEYIKRAAREYLSGPMPHAHMIGLDPDWIRRLLQTTGLMTGES